MMNDLFEREQQVYDAAAAYLEELRPQEPFDVARYENLVKEYGRLLKHLRMITKISDRAANSLNTSILDLQDKVHYDALTEIYNRRFLSDWIERMEGTMIGENLCVMMSDVDFFKRYNDTYGHSMGDHCLRAVAKTLNDVVKETGGFAARYGGEEFIAVLTCVDAVSACALAEEMLSGIRRLEIPHEHNDAADYVTISIGIAAGRMSEGQTVENYIIEADKALYISKRDGRNRYEIEYV